MSDQPQRISLAINPTAGKGRGLRSGAQAAQQLKAAGLEVDELLGKDAEDLHGQVRHALQTGTDALVVVGGDGMVHLGVTAVALTGVPLGIVPAGTGNDVAQALNLPIHDPQAAAEMIVRGLSRPEHRRTIDAIRCRPAGRPTGPAPGGHNAPDAPNVHDGHDAPGGPDRWFAGVLGAGFDALVNERANRWTHPRGRSRYILAMLRELPVFRPRIYHLELDGEARVTAAMLIAVANGPSYGGGMRVCPDAVLDDGLLDLMLVEPLSPPTGVLLVWGGPGRGGGSRRGGGGVSRRPPGGRGGGSAPEETPPGGGGVARGRGGPPPRGSNPAVQAAPSISTSSRWRPARRSRRGAACWSRRRPARARPWSASSPSTWP